MHSLSDPVGQDIDYGFPLFFPLETAVGTPSFAVRKME